MGLHDLYHHDRKLICFLEREKTAEITAVRPHQILLHLSKLVSKSDVVNQQISETRKRGEQISVKRGDQTLALIQQLLTELGDKHSERFYNLVAAKMPEDVIYTALAEVRADGATHPAKLFTYKINRYALERLKKPGLPH